MSSMSEYQRNAAQCPCSVLTFLLCPVRLNGDGQQAGAAQPDQNASVFQKVFSVDVEAGADAGEEDLKLKKVG